MHKPHINRFTIARWRDSLGLAVILVGLAMLAMVALIPIATGTSLLATVLAWTVIAALIFGAVFL